MISLPAIRRNTSGGGFALTFTGFGRDSGRAVEFLFSTLLLLLCIVRGKACGGFGLITSTKISTTKENRKKNHKKKLMPNSRESIENKRK